MKDYVPGSLTQSQNTKTPAYVPGSLTQQKTTATSSYVPGSLTQSAVKKTGSKQTSDDLYKLAVDSGLKDKADSILEAQSGESNQKIFSGGFISDIFDVLSAAQYGVTGVLKGKSFIDGVKTRQSFADKDVLGDKGLPGIIAGTLLDIAVDPLTYVAPYTLFKKIPGAVKIAKLGKEAVFGSKVIKDIQLGEEALSGVKKTYKTVEGGTSLGKTLAQKLQWMSGADPIFKETYERGLRNTAVSTGAITEITRDFTNLGTDVSSKILTKDDTGRFMRVPLEKLAAQLTPEQFDVVRKAYTKLDNLSKEAADLGLISKDKIEETLGEYIKNAYTEYDLAKTKGLFGRAVVGLKGFKKRVEGLTPERMKELGQIDNPAYLLFKSMVDLTKEVENAKMFKEIAGKFGTDVAQEGFTQLPKNTKFTITKGTQSNILSNIKDINTKIKPMLGDLKRTFSADKKVLSEINNIEKEIARLSETRSDELYKFFNEGEFVAKEVPVSSSVGGASKLPEKLQNIGRLIEQFDGSLTKFLKSPDGIKLESLFENGILERSGFDNMDKFFNFIKEPYKTTGGYVSSKKAVGNLPKIVNLQKKIETLISKNKTLKEIDKVSINDSFRNLEKNINELRFAKENLVDDLSVVKLGDLAGKYVPDHMATYLNEIIEPSADTLAKQLVGTFKYYKVVMNPATHARNIISNKILNYWKLGMNPLSPKTIDAEIQSYREIKKGAGKWIDEAKPLGYGVDTFASNELRDMLEDPATRNALSKAGGAFSKLKNTLGNLYQAEESQSKLSAYIYNRKYNNLSPEDAWKAAESATFNYAQITPFVRKLRESMFGMPFITFTVKATPLAIETALKNPRRVSVIGKIKQSIEKMSGLEENERERQNEPSWVKDGFYVKLPMKDSQGRSAYFDLTYILPFGDLLSGNFFERGQNMQTGTPESVPTAILKKSPFIQLVSEIGKNRDFYGNKIWRESDSPTQQLKDLSRHITKFFAPPPVADLLPGGYNDKGIRQQRGIIGALKPKERENQQRTVMQELLRNVGAKVQPVDADIAELNAERNRKKGLETLLLENNVLDEFTRTYKPKK